MGAPVSEILGLLASGGCSVWSDARLVLEDRSRQLAVDQGELELVGAGRSGFIRLKVDGYVIRLALVGLCTKSSYPAIRWRVFAVAFIVVSIPTGHQCVRKRLHDKRKTSIKRRRLRLV